MRSAWSESPLDAFRQKAIQPTKTFVKRAATHAAVAGTAAHTSAVRCEPREMFKLETRQDQRKTCYKNSLERATESLPSKVDISWQQVREDWCRCEVLRHSHEVSIPALQPYRRHIENTNEWSKWRSAVCRNQNVEERDR